MRLIDILHRLDDDVLDTLVERHLGTAEIRDRATMFLDLEGELRSPNHVRHTIYNLQPPAFAILELLLGGDGHSVDVSGLRDRAETLTRRLSEAVSSGSVARRPELELYRRVMAEARRSDLELDPSEIALLQVLRRELGIRTVEHFLVEHHADLRQFWDTDVGFLSALDGLRNGGAAFAVDNRLVLPAELVPLVRKVLGIEVNAEARRRLFERMSVSVLTSVAQALGIKSAGSKDEKVARLVDNYVQASEVLEELGIGDLKELCRDIGLAVTGSKQELVERIVNGFASDADIRPARPEALPPSAEPRSIERLAFEALLLSLRQSDLSDILVGIDSKRVTGAKEQLVQLVIESPFSEVTLLRELASKQLDVALDRAGLKSGGTKDERIRRLIVHYTRGAATHQ